MGLISRVSSRTYRKKNQFSLIKKTPPNKICSPSTEPSDPPSEPPSPTDPTPSKTPPTTETPPPAKPTPTKATGSASTTTTSKNIGPKSGNDDKFTLKLMLREFLCIWLGFLRRLRLLFVYNFFQAYGAMWRGELS